MKPAASASLLALILAAAACVPFAAERVDLTLPGQWEQSLHRKNMDPGAIENPLAVTPEMRAEARSLAGQGTSLERLDRLKRSLLEWSRRPFEYNPDRSLTAIEAFKARSGNCLSFTSLFIAMARSAGIPVSAAEIRLARQSYTDGDLILVNTHIAAIFRVPGGTTIYDFRDVQDPAPIMVRALDDIWVGAIFANNRGVDELRAGRLQSAVKHFDAAVRLVPGFADAHANLGVALRRLGDTSGAVQAYYRALAISPHDPVVLQNLAALYRAMGRDPEAGSALTASKTGVAPPLEQVILGDLLAAQGKDADALHLYRRAHKQDPRLPEPLVAIARVQLHMGRRKEAEQALREALALDPENSEALNQLGSLSPAAASPDSTGGR
jgi:Flp pilus assembly protein TadD